MTDAELRARIAYCWNPKDYCRAGGRNGGHENYGLPHVTGWLRLEDGERHTTRCIFCGSDCQ